MSWLSNMNNIFMNREVKATLGSFQKALEDHLPRMKNRDSFGDDCVKFKKATDRDSVCYWYVNVQSSSSLLLSLLLLLLLYIVLTQLPISLN